MGRGGSTVVFAVLIPLLAGGEDVRTTDVTEPAPSEESAKPATDALEVQLKGRVFARALSDERREFSRDLSIPSARLGVAAELGLANAAVTADLADSSLLKDAYVRVREPSARFSLTGGRFKAPFLARELESAWDLPLIWRGLVDDYLSDRSSLGGRRIGLMAEGKLPGKVRLSAGVFEGSRDELGVRRAEDAAMRLSVKPLKGVTLAAGGYLAGAFGSIHARAATADVTWKLSALSLSAEGTLGTLPVGRFRSGALLAAYDIPLGAQVVLQPVTGAEVLVLSGATTGQGWTGTGGLNLLYAERVRAQLQVERALLPGDRAPANRWLLQLGARL